MSHYIVLPDPGTFIEYVAPESGQRFVADPVTALLLTSDEFGRLHAVDAAANHPAVIPIESGRERCTVRSAVLSPQALFVAQRLRDSSSDVETFLRHVQPNVVDTPNARRRCAANRVRKALASAPGAPHRIADLAASVGMSPFHLARVFRAETGLSVHQYLLRLRMASALDRLAHAPRDISRLALDLGFSSHSHFTAAFRRQFGAGPASVRSALRDTSNDFWIREA